MSLSESQKRGNKKYQDLKCMRISLILSKDIGEILLNHIAKNESTKNGFIIQAIKEKIERETNKNFDDVSDTIAGIEVSEPNRLTGDRTTKAGIILPNNIDVDNKE